MAFEVLSEKFQRAFKKIRGQSRLTESNMDEILKEIRIALLEADVNFKVVKSFIENIKAKALGTEVYTKLNPSQMVVKIVKDELEALLGGNNTEISFSQKPTVILLAGLQGTGKTTTAAKLALSFKKKMNLKVLLCACDVHRPAAIDQLLTLGKQINVDVYCEKDNKDAVSIANSALKKTRLEFYDVLIVDTAGRLQIDNELMKELENISNSIRPNEKLLIVDAMSGQDAINVANEFNSLLSLTGLIMSKLDGDARGGSALSIKYLTGLPIKYAGVGEKLNDLDVFHADRMADRILGMGDVVTLVEKVQEEIDEKEAMRAANKMLEGRFTLDDLLKQMKQIQKMGDLGGLMKLIPGMPKISDEQKATANKEMKVLEAIINSMTAEEKNDPAILKNSRKIRIARGSGTTSADINRLLKKYEQTKQMMDKFSQYKKTGRFPPGMNFPGM